MTAVPDGPSIRDAYDGLVLPSEGSHCEQPQPRHVTNAVRHEEEDVRAVDEPIRVERTHVLSSVPVPAYLRRPPPPRRAPPPAPRLRAAESLPNPAGAPP